MSWYESFFSGAALDLWRRAIPPEKTEDEARFLQIYLELEPGLKVLDVPCGNARLGIPIALMDCEVTGVDLAAEFLEEAEKKAKQYEVKLNLVRKDMKNLDQKDIFDGAFCMGNSFGYFDSVDSNAFLSAVSKSLKSGAHFILHTCMSAETFLVSGAEREWIKAGNMHMLIENVYDCKSSSVTTQYTFLQNGKEELRTATHWIYTSGEICRMLNGAGFDVLHMFESTDEEPFTLGSNELYVVARKRQV